MGLTCFSLEYCFNQKNILKLGFNQHIYNNKEF